MKNLKNQEKLLIELDGTSVNKNYLPKCDLANHISNQ